MIITDIAQEDFRGNIYVVRSGDTVFEYSGGYADLTNRRPNTMETRFGCASGSKAFVAAGILRLIHQGKIRFDDTIGKLLDIDLRDIDPGVTVEMLLTHTSGVPDYFDESVMDDYEALWHDFPNYRIRHNSDLMPLFIDKPMMYPKGTEFRYNNTGYVMLAMIIEKITWMPFDQYLEKEIFAPCGMTRTGYYEFDRLPEGCANGYIWCPDGGYRTNIYSLDAKGTGAGGAFVTVGDIMRFWRGLLEDRLFPKELAADMMNMHSGDGADPEEGWYGYGLWLIEKAGGGYIPYFQGCDEGATFISEYHPDTDTISVAVSNYGDNVWKVMRNIRSKLY